MTSTRTGRADLLDRISRIEGWGVEKAANGLVKVTNPDGEVLTVHSTVGDFRGVRILETELNRLGFREDEAKAAAERETQRQAKLDADRAANERRTAALVRAQGPYAPAAVTIGEILSAHPTPRVYHMVTVTPDMARALLNRNTGNRAIRDSDVARWCRILRGGRWRYTHQGVALDTNGQLQDGQHRLTAIVETNLSADMMISVGMPVENFAVVDSGRRRTAGQVIGMRSVRYSSTVAGAVRLLHLHATWGPLTLDHAREPVDNDEVAAAYDKLDHEMLDSSIRWAHWLRQEIGTAALGPAAGHYLICAAVGPESLHVQGFSERLIRGTDTDPEAPLHVLRRTLTRQAAGVARKLSPAQGMALLIKGWNAHHEGKRARMIVIRDGATMPVVYVPKTGA